MLGNSMFTDITEITKGVIMHQVNCQNVMGAGVAKALYTKHPQVKARFHQLATQPGYNTPEKRFGVAQPVKINEQLIIVNSFSQLCYGREKRCCLPGRRHVTQYTIQKELP